MKFALLGSLLTLFVFSAHAQQKVERGIASYYGKRFQGKRTASGEPFDKDQLTAAHRTLPFGTLVKVTAEHNGKFVYVRINDRGPFVKNRLIDVSRKAAEELGIVRRGHGDVLLEVMGADFRPEDLAGMDVSSAVTNRIAKLSVQQLDLSPIQGSILPVLERKTVNMELPVKDLPETFIRKLLQEVFPES